MASQIYISFSAEKNGHETWESELVNYLKTTLQKIADRSIQIYSAYDPGLNTEQAKNQSRVLLVVINGFFSESFTNELHQLEINKKKLTEKGTEIIVIIKSGKFISLVPAFLTDCSQYCFFENNIRTNEIIDYTPLLTGDRENMFWSKLTDLAFDLKIIFNGDEIGNLIQDQQIIYLAEVSKDQIKNREILRREFMLLGYQVLPQRPLPPNYKEYREASFELIKRADFSVHIMGESYGDTPAGADYSYPELQNKLISESYKKFPVELSDNFYRFVWMPPNLEPFDEKQTQYLKRLKRELSDGKSGELIQCSIEELKELIPEINKARKAQVKGKAESSRILLLIVDHPSKLIGEIEKVALKAGFKLELIDMEKNGDLFPVNDFRKKVQSARVSIIMNNQSDSNWNQGILGLTLRNVDHSGPNSDATVALIAGPENANSLDFEALHIDFFNKEDHKLSQNIENFLHQIVEHG